LDILLVVEDLTELRLALRKVDAQLTKDLDRQLAQVTRGVAVMAKAQFRVALKAQPAKKRKRPNYRRGAAARSIRITKGKGKAGRGIYYLEGGGTPTSEHFGWVEFGGVLHATGDKRGTRTNTQSRPFVKKGRSIFPVAEGSAQLVANGLEKAMNDAMRPFL
jgi:metal-dependent amidase/aminoacylase/carboxypeptidase family protein